ncbi:MAG TPA: phage tail sheath C-terminal domain-containing protein [Candidatus Dormibacteraeota bacterium]|nr:phage tail sheath C-terminal domain-containing protein [Candidatus Dormibacteraeota bacterium]
MPTRTYPGVYVEELPSAVRTIVGVGTSTALFIGRTTQGPVGEPVRCQNPTVFDTTFWPDDPGGDLPRAVHLFFDNGGSDCWVIRIASGAQPASVTLVTAGDQPALTATAKSAGASGDAIRLRVDYKTPLPESTFNLEVFRAGVDARGNPAQLDDELWTGLSMDPTSPRYAPDFVTQHSTLIDLSAPGGPPAAAGSGISRAGRPMAAADWAAVLGSGTRFRAFVDGSSWFDVDLSGIDPANTAALAGSIADRINRALGQVRPGSRVTVSLDQGPIANTSWLTIASANGDVLLAPSSQADLAVPLMLGTAQGGLEISRYAASRPAANGIVFDASADNASGLAGLANNAFDDFTLDGNHVPLGTRLQTSNAGDRFFVSAGGGRDGVREKLAIIAAAVNGTAGFPYRAEVWGGRLAFLPTQADNTVGTIAMGTISGQFEANVRYAMLDPGGNGFQSNGTAGSPGTAPLTQEYRDAYLAADAHIDLFNLLVLPTDRDHTIAQRQALWGEASAFCERRRALLLMDAEPTWQTTQQAVDGVNALRGMGITKDHAAVFFPWLLVNEDGRNVAVGPSGAMAGLMARTDGTPGSGVWVAPAGVNADIRGPIAGLQVPLSNADSGVLNPRGINALRRFPTGIVHWGARTLDGDDDFGSQWKYIPIRRLALFIEESLYRGTQWAVFQPNDAPLWAQLRLNVGVFMQQRFREGAFAGATPQQAYFVKCDAETTTQADQDLGIVNLVIGFAPLRPAEFVVVKIQQMAGQLAT